MTTRSPFALPQKNCSSRCFRGGGGGSGGSGEQGDPGPVGPAGPAYLWWGANAIQTGDTYLWMGNADSNSMAIPSRIILPAGILAELRIRHNLPNGVDSITYTVQVNDVSTTITVTMSSGTATGHDLIHQVSIAAESEVSILCSKAAAGAGMIRTVAALRFMATS